MLILAAIAYLLLCLLIVFFFYAAAKMSNQHSQYHDFMEDERDLDIRMLERKNRGVR